MQEQEFIASLDVSFPFDRDEAALRIVSRGAALSDNAALAVGLALIACAPDKFTFARVALLEMLCLERPTEAVQVAAPVIESLIRNEPPAEWAVQQLACFCEQHADCHSALKLLRVCDAALKR